MTITRIAKAELLSLSNRMIAYSRAYCRNTVRASSTASTNDHEGRRSANKSFRHTCLPFISHSSYCGVNYPSKIIGDGASCIFRPDPIRFIPYLPTVWIKEETSTIATTYHVFYYGSHKFNSLEHRDMQIKQVNMRVNMIRH